MTPADRVMMALSSQRNQALDALASVSAERDALRDEVARLAQFEPKSEPEGSTMEYDNLLACYRSGQMSEAQLTAHLEGDPAFAAWFKARD